MSKSRAKRSQPRSESFTIGWICALPVEFAAAREMLDDEYEEFKDKDSYLFGRVGENYVILACLPAGQIGTNSAAVISTKLQSRFPSIRLGIMVGIGGGVPSAISDIRLGDVVVSQPSNGFGGVVQYDFGKTGAGGHLMPTGFLNTPPAVLLNAMARVQANHHTNRNMILAHLSVFDCLPKFTRENTDPDVLFKSTYQHIGGSTCEDCKTQGKDSVVERVIRRNQKPKIHYGTIASGNQIMKDGVTRDRLSSELGGVLCFEMEAAGLMNSLPCVVVRGICDYADSHKNKTWQGHAAAVAAAYAKELLLVLPAAETMTVPILDRAPEDGERYALNLIRSIQPASSISWEQVSNAGDPESATCKKEEQLIYKNLLESLSFKRMDGRLLNIKTAHGKTCTWLFEQTQFKDWLDNSKAVEHHGFLWLKGKPGSGKSTIMKTALAWTKRRRSRETVISYFFNARAPSVLEKSSLGMYRSLVHQLVQGLPYLQNHLTDHFIGKQRDGVVDDWTVEELQHFLHYVVESLEEHPLVIYIDALDEGEEDDIRQMVEFLEEIAQVSIDNRKLLRVCLSSRHYPYISIKKGLSVVVEGQSGHDNDIKTYVRNKLLGDESTEMEALRTELYDKASGVFLWVVLVVPILNKLYDHGQVHAMKRRLHDIPEELDGLFAEILARDTDNADSSILLLQWSLFARRPLSPIELYFAVRSGSAESQNLIKEIPNEGTVERYILNCSRGLTEVTASQPPSVQFIHETVRDFLLRENGLAKLRPVLQENMVGSSQDQLRNCCSRYLFNVTDSTSSDIGGASKFRLMKLQEEQSKQFPFLEYAVCNILHHADAAEGNAISQKDFLRNFNKDDATKLEIWIYFRNLFQRYQVRRYTAKASLLYIVSTENLSNLLRVLIEDSVDVNVPGERYGNALQAACATGCEKAARLLIDAQADVNAKGGEHRHALVAAIFSKKYAIMEMLHNGGAIIPVNMLDKQIFTTLDRGFVLGTRFLLDKGGNVKSRDRKSRTPLYVAAEKEYIEIMQLLLEKGADVNALGGFYGNALAAAAHGGNISAVQLLLEKGADVNASGGHHGSALQVAAQGGHTSIVQLLLGKGADLNASGGHYGNALQAAVEGGHPSIVQLLLGKGADVNALGRYLGNALQAAVEGGHTSMMQRLLEMGVDVNALVGYSGTALQIAAARDHTSMVQLLLEKGADVNAFGGPYGNALQAAASRGGSTSIVQLLLEKGADLNALGGFYGSALQAAAWGGHTSIVQLLLKKGADVNALGGLYGSALQAAAEGGNISTVQLLLEKGADVNVWVDIMAAHSR